MRRLHLPAPLLRQGDDRQGGDETTEEPPECRVQVQELHGPLRRGDRRGQGTAVGQNVVGVVREITVFEEPNPWGHRRQDIWGADRVRDRVTWDTHSDSLTEVPRRREEKRGGFYEQKVRR